MKIFTSGTVLHSLYRALLAALAFGIPLLLSTEPTWANISIGTILMAIAHYALSQKGL